MRRFACVVVSLLVLSAIPFVSASEAQDDRAAIREVFETVFNHRKPLDKRVSLVEDGDALRAKIEQLDDARVDAIRLHGEGAEVHFELHRPSGESLGQLLPFGVVTSDQGRWKVSRYTICGLVAIRGGSACPGRSPTNDWRAYHMGKRFGRLHRPDVRPLVTPLTLPDGTRATLAPPAGVDFSGAYIRSAGALAFGNPPRRFDATHGARRVPNLARYLGAHGSRVPLDYEGNLTFRAGTWSVRIYAADLNERARAYLARNVNFAATRDGFATLRSDSFVGPYANPPALPAFGRSVPRKGVLDETSFPRLSFIPDGANGLNGQLVIAHTGCATSSEIIRPPGVSEDASIGRRCVPGTGIELGAEGFDAGFVNRLLTETEVRDVREPR